ncbi:hypothetical protein LQZ19_08595 [Treponema primitia]|uniref:hypothetical protein n=1 Tax=Treponema primitia TaxID=88058 RepID=UPI0039802091
MKLKTYVAMVNPRFEIPITETLSAIEAGNPLPEVYKRHTIRANYAFWEKRINAINRGEGVLSIRVWEGKPYRSKQREIARLEKVGIQKLHFVNFMGAYYNFTIEDLEKQTTEIDFAKNDGFSNFDDMLAWFHDYPSGDMAIIHFTSFRY